MKRNFNKWLETMKESISSWDYYTDFEKVYKNVDSIKVQLNILNTLIGSKNIKNEFISLANRYPEILEVIPILLAIREKTIKVNDINRTYEFNFKKLNYSIEEYAFFMEKVGLFDLISNHIINNLVDYVTGIEVGMDTNARKNRTGKSMEYLIEQRLVDSGYIKGKTYFKEMYKSEVERKFNIDLSSISNNGKTEKRFDFVFVKNHKVYGIECNFYGGGGSKLNETARSYKTLATESEGIKDFCFVWITDGVGWKAAKHNLEETFDILPTTFNLHDLNTYNVISEIENFTGEFDE